MSNDRNNVQFLGTQEGYSLTSMPFERSTLETELLRRMPGLSGEVLKSLRTKLQRSQRSQQQRSNLQRSSLQQLQSPTYTYVDSPFDSDSDFTHIRFQVVNRKNFRLRPEDAERTLLPIVLVGNKRRACNFIKHLNDSSPEYRDHLRLRRGELIPFKMVDADSFQDFSMRSLNGRDIRLLCIYSETFDQDVERTIRQSLVRISDEVSESSVDSMGSDDSNSSTSSDGKFIKTVSTIYLKNVNSNLKITRVKHRRNLMETQFNYFRTDLDSYSEYPEVGWQDIISLRVSNDMSADNHRHECHCPICTHIVNSAECATFTCGHSACLRCAGAISSVSRKCPFCRTSLKFTDLTLRIDYVPSLFSSIKELLIDNMPYEKYGAQSVIYVPTELAIQHLYNFLIQSVEPIEDRMEILSSTINFSLLAEGSPHHYFLACSNDLISKLPNLTQIITGTDDDHCKNLMLNFKSYGRNYGKADQELIVLNAE